MLRIVILAGLVTTTLSAFLLGAVFGVMLSPGGVAGATAAEDGAQTAAAPVAPAGATASPQPSDAAADQKAEAQVAAADATATAQSPATAAPAKAAGADAAAEPADPSAAAPDPRATAALASLEPESYTLSAGAFARLVDAQAFADELGALALPVRLVGSVDPAGREWSEVTIGPYPSSGSAARAAEDIRRAFAITPVMRPTETQQ